MTAIGAAIIELKAHCEHTWEIIRALERFAKVVEDAHGATPAVTPADVHTMVDRLADVGALKTALRKPSAKARAKTNGRQQPAKVAFTPGAAILSALGSAATPLDGQALRRQSGLKDSRFYYTLNRLMADGAVCRVGTQKRGGLYQLAHQPRPGAVAGTQAAPPVGPSPATGSRKGDGPFETVWTGTKERNGEAPSLLPPRERRS
jgi:hypothetical protein